MTELFFNLHLYIAVGVPFFMIGMYYERRKAGNRLLNTAIETYETYKKAPPNQKSLFFCNAQTLKLYHLFYYQNKRKYCEEDLFKE